MTTCNSGTACWVTDLDGTYNANSNQNLLLTRRRPDRLERAGYHALGPETSD
jgi:hypothetical protein